MLADALQEISSSESDVVIFVEETEGSIEEPGVGLWRYAKKEADFIVRMDVLREG